jgi:hypothetical protein
VLSYPASRDYITAHRTGSTHFSPDFDIAYQGALTVRAGSLLVTYVVTCLWLWRVRANAEFLAPTQSHERRRGWVWGGWLVPVVAFWFPFQVVRDIVAATADRSRGDSSFGRTVGWWWGTWLTYLLSVQVTSWLLPWDGIPTASMARALFWVEALCAVACVVALVFWIRIISGIRRSQQRTAAERTPQTKGATPPSVRVGAGAAWALVVVPALVVASVSLLVIGTFVAAFEAGADNSGVSDRDAADASSSAEGTGIVPVDTLKKGDCLSHRLAEDFVPSTVEVVPCAKSHAHEVYAVFDLPGGSFPGDRMVQGAADKRCSRAFRSYVGIPIERSKLDFFYVYPNTAESWHESRSVVCMLDNSRPSRGSYAGSRH